MTGETISHFKVLKMLGAGGMGEVYLAQDTKLDRQVALKVLPLHALASEDDRARFYREARAAAALNHANIATVYEIDEVALSTDSGVPTSGGVSSGLASAVAETRLFIAMEYVEGESLAERIARGPLPLKEVKSIASQIASGQDAAHVKGLVHRDIKSNNVMLTMDGQAKILDFGLAKTSASTRLTNLGSTLGTIAYMSPEQARGEELDARTDVWSLGAVLYEMITGRLPFPGDYEQAVVYSILNGEPEPPTALRTGVPMELERIVAKCLAKDAARRYQHADEIAVDLEGVDVRPSGLSTISPAVAAPLGPRPRSASLPIVAIVAVVAAAAGALAATLVKPETDEPRVSRQHLLVDEAWPWLPALSPDGRLLAYRGNDAGSNVAGLYVYDFEKGEVATVADEAPGMIRFSPDGSKVAFYSSGRIVTVPPGGGSPAVVVPEGASWAFAWGANGDLYYSRSGFQEVVHINAAAASRRTVMAMDSLRGEVAVYPYQMLPGDRYLLAGVTRGSPERDDLVAIDVKTGTATDLVPEAGWGALYAPTGHLAYVTGNSGPLYVRAFDPEELKVLGPPVHASPTVWAQAWTFAPSGRFANVLGSEPREHLLQVALDQRGTPLPVDTLDFGVFRVSPSGRYIALTSYSAGKSSLFIHDDVLSTQLQLAYEAVDHGTPAWSPDENRLVYSAKLETTNRIYVSRADGSGSPDLLVRSKNHASHPDWSPDGRKVMFQTEGDLWLYSFADSTARRMAPRINETGGQYRPRFSPDGSYLAYMSNESGEWEVFVARIDGTAKWRVTSDAYAAAWSDDQERLFVGKGSAIHEFRVETGPGFRVLAERVAYSSDRKIDWFDVRPGDRGFVVSEEIEEETRHFEIVDNWFEYLDQIAPHPE